MKKRLHTEEKEQPVEGPTISQENGKLIMDGTCNVSTIVLDQNSENTSDPVLPPAKKKAKTFKYITNILTSKRKDNLQPQIVVLLVIGHQMMQNTHCFLLLWLSSY